MKTGISLFISALTTGIVYFLGGWDIALKLLLIMVVLDYITGVLKAINNKEVNSHIGLKGIIKKFGYFIIVAVAVILDRIMGDTGAIRTLVIYFFIANDGISILENWGGMGLPLPQKMFDVLEQLKDDNDSKEDDEL